jgi:hypothetical protein
MRIFTLTALLIVTAGFSCADRLTLKSGDVVQGSYLGGTARQIRFDVNGAVQTYEINQVRSVWFSEDENQSSTQPGSPDRNNVPFPSQQPQGQYPRAEQPRNLAGEPPNPGPYRGDQSRNQGGPLGVTLPANTPITVRMIDSVDSKTTRLGETFRASIDQPVMLGDRQVIPRGADVVTKLVENKQSGKIEGRTVLTLALQSVSVNGQMIDVTSLDVRTASGSRAVKSGSMIGGGAAVGAIVGAIAGGGKGAAIGAASGGALGGAGAVLTSGQQVKIPSETRLTFVLQNPVQI